MKLRNPQRICINAYQQQITEMSLEFAICFFNSLNIPYQSFIFASTNIYQINAKPVFGAKHYDNEHSTNAHLVYY